MRAEELAETERREKMPAFAVSVIDIESNDKFTIAVKGYMEILNMPTSQPGQREARLRPKTVRFYTDVPLRCTDCQLSFLYCCESLQF